MSFNLRLLRPKPLHEIIDPDIKVVNNPSKLIAGIEPQLDAAIKQMMVTPRNCYSA